MVEKILVLGSNSDIRRDSYFCKCADHRQGLEPTTTTSKWNCSRVLVFVQVGSCFFFFGIQPFTFVGNLGGGTPYCEPRSVSRGQ